MRKLALFLPAVALMAYPLASCSKVQSKKPKEIPIKELKPGDFVIHSQKKCFIYSSQYVCVTISNKTYNGYKVWGGWDYSDAPVEEREKMRNRGWLAYINENDNKNTTFETYEPSKLIS